MTGRQPPYMTLETAYMTLETVRSKRSALSERSAASLMQIEPLIPALHHCGFPSFAFQRIYILSQRIQPLLNRCKDDVVALCHVFAELVKCNATGDGEPAQK
eukprot:TRINITY_DN4173_c0_g1_i1.p5 TRINITY_DN4173_c0_g1~~TRINITY_DN4173_c0_g1_i1.p5  ORF type:complete len:102 (+),score=7.92 TRINITY_DN4173_c0_g1_i1:368-673(+)